MYDDLMKKTQGIHTSNSSSLSFYMVSELNSLWTIKRHEELNVLLPFSPDVKVQQD